MFGSLAHRCRRYGSVLLDIARAFSLARMPTRTAIGKLSTHLLLGIYASLAPLFMSLLEKKPLDRQPHGFRHAVAVALITRDRSQRDAELAGESGLGEPKLLTRVADEPVAGLHINLIRQIDMKIRSTTPCQSLCGSHFLDNQSRCGRSPASRVVPIHEALRRPMVRYSGLAHSSAPPEKQTRS